MRSYVRYVAAAAASLLVFAACSGEEAATPTSPDLASGSLNYAISPAQVSWTRQPNGPMPVDTKQVLISGLIAVGGYPQFGAMQYEGATDWLEMTTVPDLSRSPLAWRFTFKLKPKAATLPIGRYTATIPVNVPAAQNNPQSIVVVFNHCDNCLYVGDERLAALSVTDLIWNRNGDYAVGTTDPDPDAEYRYDDWRVFVPAFTTVQVDMYGECDASRPDVNIDDVWLASWTTPTSIGQNDYDSDDDSGACNNSIIYLTNSGATQREFLVRATTCCGTPTGPYRIRVSIGGDDYDYNNLRTKDAEDRPLEEKLAAWNARRSGR